MNTKITGVDNKKDHEIIMKNREELSITGVSDVTSFDDVLVELVTETGLMSVEGEGIHISLLDTENGRLTLTGKMSGVYYSDKIPKRKTGLFGAKER